MNIFCEAHLMSKTDFYNFLPHPRSFQDSFSKIYMKIYTPLHLKQFLRTLQPTLGPSWQFLKIFCGALWGLRNRFWSLPWTPWRPSIQFLKIFCNSPKVAEQILRTSRATLGPSKIAFAKILRDTSRPPKQIWRTSCGHPRSLRDSFSTFSVEHSRCWISLVTTLGASETFFENFLWSTPGLPKQILRTSYGHLRDLQGRSWNFPRIHHGPTSQILTTSHGLPGVLHGWKLPEVLPSGFPDRFREPWGPARQI